MNIGTRLTALEKAIEDRPSFPKEVCRMKDGSIHQFEGICVLQPFLESILDPVTNPSKEITEVVCDDESIANLLRAMDSDRKVIIETYMIVNGKPVRQFI